MFASFEGGYPVIRSTAGNEFRFYQSAQGIGFYNNVGLNVKIGAAAATGLQVYVLEPAQKGLTVRAVASQTANLQEWQNSAGTVLSSVSAAGSLSFPSSTTNIAASANDLVLTGSAFQRINCTVASSITGIAPPAGGTHVDGRMGVRFYNTGTANLTFTHNSSLSASANRFFNVTAADIIIAPNDYAEGTYDSTNNGSGGAGWRLS